MGDTAISISESGKVVKIPGVFEDEDLLSDEERAAMAEPEVEDDAATADAEARAKEDAEAEAATAKKTAEDEDAAKKGQEALDDAEKAAKIKEADEKIAAEKGDAGETEADKAAKDAADEAAKKAAGEGSEEDAGADKPIPLPKVQPPVMMDVMSQEAVDQVTADLAASKQKFQDGEIDYDTYFEERLKSERALWQNDVAVQLSGDSIENQWQWEQNTFMADQANGWISDDDIVFSAFAATVNKIMATEEGSVLPGPDILDQAREEVAKRFSPTQEADTQAKADDEKGKKALAAVKKAQAAKAIPDTLAAIPAAEGEESGGEFGFIDKLDGEAYEKAVEALSPVQLARYENQV